MSKPIVFMFSGQGSQYYHMGKELYDNHPRFRLWMDHCDEIVYPLIETSLIDVLYRQGDKKELFDNILYTNPALLCIEYSLSRVLEESNIHPDYLLGYSLGEITTSVISGAMSLEDGLKLTVDFAKILINKSKKASMLAIIESESIMNRFPELFKNCWLTGRNFKNNFVITGLPEEIKKVQERLTQEEIISQKLAVNFGFHTELIDMLKAAFLQRVKEIEFSSIKIPTISALTTGIIEAVDAQYLWNVVREPVEFEKTIQSMLTKEDYTFIDVGPSGSLATFVKYLLPAHSNSVHKEVINQFGKDLVSVDKLKASLRYD
jgi:bacillaene synthase trans-acting acyltransferase